MSAGFIFFVLVALIVVVSWLVHQHRSFERCQLCGTRYYYCASCAREALKRLNPGKKA